MAYLFALGLTLAVEIPAYASLLDRELDISRRRAGTAGLLVNLASHPLAFLVLMPRIAPALGYLPALAIVELWVWLFEAVLLWVYLRRAAEVIGLVALLANALSLAAGLLIFA